jgi:hypothetical protein
MLNALKRLEKLCWRYDHAWIAEAMVASGVRRGTVALVAQHFDDAARVMPDDPWPICTVCGSSATRPLVVHGTGRIAGIARPSAGRWRTAVALRNANTLHRRTVTKRQSVTAYARAVKGKRYVPTGGDCGFVPRKSRKVKV